MTINLDQLSNRLSKHKTLLLFIMVAVFVVLANLLVMHYINTEKNVYYWDNSAYWTSAIALLHSFETSIRSGLAITIQSLQTDYNYLPILPIVPILKAFGISRLTFVLAIVNLYVIPTTIIAVWLFQNLFYKKASGKFLAMALFAILLFPSLLLPALTGQVDAVGLLVIAVILLVFSKMDFTKYSPIFSVALGTLMCLLVVLRRWYSYWAIGAVVVLTLVVIYRLVKSSGFKLDKTFLKMFVGPFLNMITIGLTSLALMYFLFNHLLAAYTINYSDLYSAYKDGGLLSQVVRFGYYFGIVPIIIMLFGLAIAFFDKRFKKRRIIAAFFAMQTVLVFLLFIITQNFSAHHYYLLLPLFIYSYLVVITYILQSNKRVILGAILSVIIVLSFVNAFVSTSRESTAHLLLGEQNSPVVRKDISTLKDLVAYVEAVKQPSDTTYIISSSDTFNDSLLRDVDLPNRFIDNILTVSHVDKRDGFPNGFFGANYVLVANPVQYHLTGGQGQMVITVLADAVLSGSCANLTKLKEFSIDNGVKVEVFKRTGKYDEAFVSTLRSIFKKEYGNYPNLYDINQQ